MGQRSFDTIVTLQYTRKFNLYKKEVKPGWILFSGNTWVRNFTSANALKNRNAVIILLLGVKNS